MKKAIKYVNSESWLREKNKENIKNIINEKGNISIDLRYCKNFQETLSAIL